MKWKFWTWLGGLFSSFSPLPSPPASQAREALRFGVELTAEESKQIQQAFAVPGHRMEDHPQLGAVALLIEQLFAVSHNAACSEALEPGTGETLRSQAAYQRALRDLLGQMRAQWDGQRKI